MTTDITLARDLTEALADRMYINDYGEWVLPKGFDLEEAIAQVLTALPSSSMGSVRAATPEEEIGGFLATIAGLSKENADLKAQLASLQHGREQAIEECARIAETFADKNQATSKDRSRFTIYDVQRYTRLTGQLIAEDIRTLSSKTDTREGWQPIETAPKDGTPIIGAYFNQPWAESHRSTLQAKEAQMERMEAAALPEDLAAAISLFDQTTRAHLRDCWIRSSDPEEMIDARYKAMKTAHEELQRALNRWTGRHATEFRAAALANTEHKGDGHE